MRRIAVALVLMYSTFALEREAEPRGSGIGGYLHKLSGPGPWFGFGFNARAPLNAFEFSIELTTYATMQSHLQQLQTVLMLQQQQLQQQNFQVAQRESVQQSRVIEIEKRWNDLLRDLERIPSQLEPPSLEDLAIQDDLRTRGDEDYLNALAERLHVVQQWMEATEQDEAKMKTWEEKADCCSCGGELRGKCRPKHWFNLYAGGAVTCGYEQMGDKTATIWWIAVEPTYEYRVADLREGLFVGGGYAFNYFLGEGFENFWRGSITVPKVRWAFHPRIGIAGELIYFPTSFTRSDFGGEFIERPSGGEWTWGISLTLKLWGDVPERT